MGIWLIALAAALWALVGVMTRGALNEGVGAMEIAFWRSLLAGGVFFAQAAALRQLHIQRRTDLYWLLGFGLIGGALFFGAYTKAIETGGISLAVVLLYTAPAFVVVLARLILKESLTVTKALILLLVSAGVVLVTFGGGTDTVHVTPQSITWGLLAGLSYGSFYIFGKRLLERYSPALIFGVSLLIGALCLLPFVDFAPKTPTAWLWIGLLALLCTYLSSLLYGIGLRQVEASRAVLVACLEPVIAAALAALFFAERLGPWGLLGGLLVVTASLSAALLPTQRPPPEHPGA